ncbi:hypothetical protein H9L39_02272 [Fusarium oxysporum f. sp. albedinis]|nr:hypothetical protein H9L39_02272 [Fusarium oxysporum f. sp. albedinis]
MLILSYTAFNPFDRRDVQPGKVPPAGVSPSNIKSNWLAPVQTSPLDSGSVSPDDYDGASVIHNHTHGLEERAVNPPRTSIFEHGLAFAKSPYNAYAFRAVANSTIGDFSDDELLRNMPFPSVRGISVWFSSLVKSMHRILESDKLNIGATRPQLFFPIFRLE